VRVAKALTALQGVAILSGEPEARVLFVANIEARGAAAALLRHYVAICADGPLPAADLAPLQGRLVDIWAPGGADGADWAAGVAARLVGTAERVRVINNSEWHEGRDLPALLAEGWSEDATLKWAAEHIKPVERPASSSKVVELKRKHPGREPLASVASADHSALAVFQGLPLVCDGQQVPHPTLANASAIIHGHPELAGKIWFDRFRGHIRTNLVGEERAWSDTDDANIAVWIQQSLRLHKFHPNMVKESVMHAARLDLRNSLTDWLSSLTWDGTARLEDWVGDCLGVVLGPYSRAVGRNWLLSMVARAYRPGCQADHMPVLEGRMGVGKSSFLALLGAPWYSSLPEAFGSKDFLQAIQGQWLIEVPDMAGFSRREHTHIIAVVTTRTDRYRASYGRHTEDHPRQCVFAATSETDDYLQDSRGIRRYWPLRCQSIDLEAFASQREQLFAEAVSVFQAGASWYEMPSDAKEEQEQRFDADPWSDMVLDWCSARSEVTATDVLLYCIEMGAERIDQTAKKRVAGILKNSGQWRQIQRNDHKVSRRLWVRRD
jgi:putative DNA primase/helicase